MIETSEVNTGVCGVGERLDGVDERAHTHLVASIEKSVNTSVDIRLVIKTEADFVGHRRALFGCEVRADAEFIENVLICTPFFGRSTIPAVGDDGRSSPSRNDSCSDPKEC